MCSFSLSLSCSLVVALFCKSAASDFAPENETKKKILSYHQTLTHFSQLLYILPRFRTLIAAALVASCVAFAPSSARASRSTSLAAARSKSIPFLIQPPKLDGSLAGDEGFDPLGLSNIDSAELGIDLYWMREAELKHARVAMLAILGALAQEVGFVVPGLPSGKNQVAVFWECLDRNPGPIFAAVIFLGIAELFSGIAITEGRKSGRAPGDWGFNPLSFGKTDASKKDLAVKEIRNGRLAMWAAAGMLLQGTVTNAGALENLF